ncbi:hypothetical protein GQR58_019554 [Nymphon striatum]|nr:hypothetical protein GQR58_019554 [Nymphon striatum]
MPTNGDQDVNEGDKITNSPTEVSPAMQHGVGHVSVKAAAFIKSAASGWFQIMNAQFHLAGINNRQTKFYHTLAALPAEIIDRIPEDILSSTDYEQLKSGILDLFQESKAELFNKLMSNTVMTGKPSQFIEEMAKIARKDGITNDFIQHKFIQSVPPSIAPFLATQKDMTLSQLGKLADELLPFSRKPLPANFSNAYYVFNNEANPQRRKLNQKDRHWDDCGAWVSGASNNTVFVCGESSRLTEVKLKDGVYGTLYHKRVNGGRQRIFTAMEQQPQPDSVIVVHRAYVKHIQSAAYKRRITWITGADDNLAKTAVAEYIGTFPGRAQHGNTKTNRMDYIRTKPETVDKIKENAQHQPPHRVWQDLNGTVEIGGPRSRKQVANAKYRDKKKQQQQTHGSQANFGDHIQSLEKMVKTDRDFVRSVKITGNKVSVKIKMYCILNKVGVSKKDRSAIIRSIFGPDGVTSADEQIIFDYRLNQTKQLYRETAPDFDKYFTDQLTPLQTSNFNTKTDRPWTATLGNWTNNNCESMNAVLKHVAEWKSQPLTTLVNKLHKVVNSQYQDLRSALAGQGDLVLCGPYQRFAVPIDVWVEMDKSKRDNLFKRFMRQLWLVDQRTVISTDGNLTVNAPTSNGGKKPHQVKRKRAAKTTTIPNKKKLPEFSGLDLKTFPLILDKFCFVGFVMIPAQRNFLGVVCEIAHQIYSSSSSAGESSTLLTTDDGTMYSSSTSNNDGVVLLQV